MVAKGAGKNDGRSSKLICLWSVPRSCSTVFERSVMNRTDMEHVYHEPLGVPYYYGPKDQRGSTRYDQEKERESLDEVLQEMADARDATVASGSGKHVFSKDMAYYLAGSDGTIDENKLNKVVDAFDEHTFLIKNPIRQVPSLHRMSTEQPEQIGWSTFDKREVGYSEIKALFDAVSQKASKKPVVVDADELLKNPKAVLSGYCDAIGLPFEEERMMSWDPEDEHVKTKFKEWDGWHDHAIQSRGWGTSNNGRRIRTLDPKAQAVVDEVVKEVTPLYQELFENRLKVDL